MCFKKLFHRKERKIEQPVKKVKKMDLSKYNIKINMKVLCYYEQLTNKSGFAIDMSSVPYLLYSMFVANNNIRMDYEAFTMLLETDNRMAVWLLNEYMEQTKMISILSNKKETDENEATSGNPNTEQSMVTDIVANLISVRGMDPHYVMYEMELWELEKYAKQIEYNTRDRYEENRLWTFYTIAPHIDTKKIKKPEDLIPFPWEKEKKETSRQNFVDKNKEAILRTLRGKKKEEDNGKTDG